ncbi:MAG: arginine--tRNA ligase [Anaerolineae bacterium]|nr:arginine--tRNA ligase [Anaerolineae bacterium]
MKLLPHEHARLIQQAIRAAQAAGALPAFPVPAVDIQPSKRADQGDYAATIALQLAKLAGQKPRAIAEAIVQHLPAADFVAGVEIAGPGFINFTLSRAYLLQQIEAIIAEDDTLFTLDLGQGRRAQVEFVSANPTGPITIGRSRGGIAGDTMARLLSAAGYSVEREYYFNNAGNQMVMLGNSLKVRYLQALGRPVTVPDKDDATFYQGEYLIDFARQLAHERGEALVDADWKPFKEYVEVKMFEWIKESLARIGIVHDVFFNEDSLYQEGSLWAVLAALKEKGYIYSAAEWEGATEAEKAKAAGKQPAQWFRTTAFGDDKDRVLVKSDGTPTYTLPDIAYHKNKIERGFDLMINVLGADHGTQYKIVQYGISALGMDPAKIHVILNQMVSFVRDGRPFKGSTRRGVFDTLDELVDEVGADAIRYHLLARSPGTHLEFDMDAVVKQSNDNPVYYIQNAYVRCCGIFREAEARGLTDDGADLSLLSDTEIAFIRKVLEMGEVIETAVTHFEPHRIAFYAQELAGVFHPIYDQVRVLHTEVPADVAKARLRFYRAARVAFRRVLLLMGMSTPERM